MNDKSFNDEIHLKLLKLVEKDPKASQRDLAKATGVSLGKVNYCLKALVKVGWVKVGNFARSNNKVGYVYLLTPRGIAEKTALTTRFIEYKQQQYDTLKQEIEELRAEERCASLRNRELG